MSKRYRPPTPAERETYRNMRGELIEGDRRAKDRKGVAKDDPTHLANVICDRHGLMWGGYKKGIEKILIETQTGKMFRDVQEPVKITPSVKSHFEQRWNRLLRQNREELQKRVKSAIDVEGSEDAQGLAEALLRQLDTFGKLMTQKDFDRYWETGEY